MNAKRPVIIPIGPSIAIVTLTKGKESIVDACDAERVGRHNWCAHTNPRAGKFYGITVINGRRVTLQSFILGIEDGLEGDHISGNTLDNRRAAIRIASHSQNLKNQGMPKNNTSGYKGVHWQKNAKKFMAYIKVNYKRIYLGLFDCPKQAHAVYCAAADKHFGEFARYK